MSYKTLSHKRAFRLSTPVRLGVAAVTACFLAAPVLSNPVNPTVVNGAASFNQAGSVLKVVNTPGAIINWDKFSIQAGETTHFAQTAASSTVLNRVLNDPTAIYGTLSSNGRVWLVNPAGIMVGPGGRVDTAGFVASTLGISNENFLAGRHLFINDGSAKDIINQGEIKTPAGGSVYLIGTNVGNEGIITTPQGETILAAGATVSLIDSATPGVKVDITGATGNVTNLGTITAEAGRIGIAGVIVRNSGTLSASSVVSDGGRIFLKASQDAYVDGNGRIVTTGTKGGSVEVLGNRVAVMDNASIDASGTNGGGSIKVGGDYQGKNPEIQNGAITFFGAGATLKADATEVGDGGTVIVWADDTTRAYGNISARGGANGGNGGFVETSGHHLETHGVWVSTSAPIGQAGTWLLDPLDVTINSNATNFSYGGWTGSGSGPFSFAPTGAPSNVYAGDIQTNLGNGNVTVTTVGTIGGGAGDITVSAPVTWASGNSLTLSADGSIAVNAGITNTGTANAALSLVAKNNIVVGSGVLISKTSGSGKLDITLNSNSDVTGGGGVWLDTGSVLNSNGGNIVIGGGVTPASGYAVGNGSTTGAKTLYGGVTVLGDITAGNGSVTMHGEGANSGSNHLADGIMLGGGLLSSNGTVIIDGKAHVHSETTAGTEVTAGVDFVGGGTRLSTQTGTVTVTGLNNAPAGSFRAQGITVGAGTIIETTGTGTLTLTGTSTSLDTAWGVGVFGGTIRTTAAAGGALTLNGTNIANPDGGVVFQDGHVLSGGGAINIIGESTDTPVGFINTAPNTLMLGGPNSGNITITGLNAGAIRAVGSYAGVIDAGAANLELNGAAIDLNNFTLSAGSIRIRAGAVGLTLPASTSITASGDVELGPLNNADMCIGGPCAGALTINPSILSRVNPTGVLILGRAVADTGYTGTLTVKSGTTISSADVINGSKLALNGYDVVVETGASIGIPGVPFGKSLDILANRNLTVYGGIVLDPTKDLVMNAGQSVVGVLSLNNPAAPIYAGNITLNNPGGAITGSTVLQTPISGTLSVNAYGGIDLFGDNSVGTFVASNSGFGGINFFNTGDFNLGVVTNYASEAPILIGGGNSIIQTGDLTASGGAISVTANNNLTMNSATKAQSSGGLIHYQASNGSVQLGLLDAGAGFVNVLAGESITGNGDPTNIRAYGANLDAGYADNSSLPKDILVDTQVSVLNADNTHGVGSPSTIEVHNSGSALAVNVYSDSDTGQLTITNNGTIDVGHIGGATHTTLTATGATSDITVAYGGGMGPATLLAGGNIVLEAGRDILVMHDYVDAGGTVTATAGHDIRIASDTAYGAYIQAATGIKLTMNTGGLYIDGTAAYGASITTTSGDINLVTGSGFKSGSVTGYGGTISAPGGRWLIYAPNPSMMVGAPTYMFKQYNTAYGGVIQGAITDSGVVYTLAPTISVGLTGAVNKLYDGTNAALLVPANYVAPTGMVDGDAVVVVGNPASATYDTKNVGTGKTVSVGGLSITATNGAADVYGYLFNGTASGAVGTITPVTLSLSGLTANSKIYDATTAATVSGTFSGVIAGDAVSLGTPDASFDNKNVGIAKPVTVSGLTLAGADAGNYSFTPPTPATLTADITPASLSITGLTAQDKFYDGTTVATLAGGTLAGLISGDVVSFSPGAGAFADRHVGQAKTVTIDGLTLSGTDAGNYKFISPAVASTTANIMQLSSVSWVGGTDNNWSTAANWSGGALPDRANVAAVNLGNGTVRYDYSGAVADAAILGSLSGTGSLTLSGGTLTVNGGTLAIPTWVQTAGDLRGTGGLMVSQSMAMNGIGTIDIGGPVTISHNGDLNLGRVKTADALSVTATGRLSGTNAAGTWVHTAKSIMLDALGIGEATDMLQTRTQDLKITNRGGNAWVFNTGLVNLTGSSVGGLHLESLGGIATGSSQITAGGGIELIALSPISIGTGGVQGGTGVLLRAMTPDASSSILISGPVSSPGGPVVIVAYNDVTQSANITGGSVSVSSAAGSIQMAPVAQTVATGGNISYSAPAGSMTLASINAGSGSVSLDAGGSIASAAGVTGANIIGASAFINAGGSLELSTNVTLLDVDVGGSFAVTNGGIVFSNQPANSIGPDLAVTDLIKATDNVLTEQTPTEGAAPPPDTARTDASKPVGDPGNTTGGTEGTFGSEGDKPSTETKKDEKDKKEKKSDEAQDEKRDDKPVAKKVAQCI